MTETKKPVEKTETKKEVKKVATKGTKFAIIEISGVQLKITEGKEYEITKIAGEKGDKLEITEVLLISEGEDIQIGNPYIKGAKVALEITSQKKGKKIVGLKFKAKSRYRKHYGFRPQITRILVKKI